MLQQNRTYGRHDSPLRGVEVEGAVFTHTSFAFPWFLVSFWGPCLVTNVGLLQEEPERLERSVGLLLPGESEGFNSLLSLIGHSLAKCPTPSHS